MLLSESIYIFSAGNDFKISFIPKPWEFNNERNYIILSDRWKFSKIQEPDYKKYSSFDYDDSRWQDVTVPFNWCTLGEEMDKYEGEVCYRKKVNISKDFLRKRIFLNFWGSNYITKVYLNEKFIGEHEGGYTSFGFDITDSIKEGENLLVVFVNNAIGENGIQVGDWWNYGGIHREVFLELTEENYIKDLIIKTELDKNFKRGLISIDIEINKGEGLEAEAKIYYLKKDAIKFVKKIKENIKGDKILLETYIEKLKLWSPDEPNLYFLKVLIIKDKKVVDGQGSIFGIRKFEIKGRTLYLNGKEVFLKGINRHDEVNLGEFPLGGRVMTEKERIRDFQLIKELGANSMRTGHYPNHPYNYYITDRLGIMVIEENGVGKKLNLDNGEVIQKVKNVTKEMIGRDKNHPSIIMWSIGNEYDSDRYIDFTKEISSFVKSSDYRPILLTDCFDVKEAYKYVDVLCRNEYYGWYDLSAGKVKKDNLKKVIETEVDKLLQIYNQRFPNMPLIIMETGAEAVAGYHSKSDRFLYRGSEEYQANVLKFQLEEILKKDYVVGVFPWIFADFRTCRSFGTCQFLPHLNQKGLVSFKREKKLSFHVVKEIYKNRF